MIRFTATAGLQPDDRLVYHTSCMTFCFGRGRDVIRQEDGDDKYFGQVMSPTQIHAVATMIADSHGLRAVRDLNFPKEIIVYKFEKR